MSWLKNRFSRAHWSRKESQIALRGPETQEQGSPTPVNQTIFQGFEWHTPGGHWTRLSAALQTYADLGITSIWLPPGCKANQPDGNGYDCYDLWDLGEFEQKGSRSTKWGSREELRDLMEKARSLGIGIIWDAVLNHKTAGDTTEECWAVEVDPEGRLFTIFPISRASHAQGLSFRHSLTRPNCHSFCHTFHISHVLIYFILRPQNRGYQASQNRAMDPLYLPRPRRQIQQHEVALAALQRHRLGPTRRTARHLQDHRPSRRQRPTPQKRRQRLGARCRR
ncbi:hypothetical protein MPH_10907 [Macrophomina phaseolina MS6]|uniref:Glycosyl hydrolase family 13 catalytic domain-containing protein n=1 Tax=Macrophomina phaseolina (strain MS6) TaxID=1126212 RepID=K2RGL1_MACPH|nr:hypothetical protein MPH_10907 [Macrophomina phaseolina MS6]